ncbi:MAG: proline dehydrogenase family protein [Rubinisphaera brasiliensis]|uniref:proline dehydrogenase family protein n=1 Tax=Rubinisphaera brasiliensis TaxID=119 RepID=UPI00391CB877
MTVEQDVAQDERIESETQRIGRSVWNQLSHQRPTLFDRRWLDDRIMSWAMADESIKVQMFRFVDVLPMLRDHEAINRHLHEYFEDVQESLPWAARLALHVTDGNRVLGRALAVNARSNARRMAERFIAGSKPEEVLKAIRKIRDSGFAFTLDLLGEAVLSEEEADRYQQAYIDLIEQISEPINALPESAQVDANHLGSIPRVNVSLKLSALDSHFNPADPEGTTDRVLDRLRPILRTAQEYDAFVNIDMEQYEYKDLTYAIFKQVFVEEEFRDFFNAGIVCQAYLKDSADDLKQLKEWAEQRGTAITVRLVKGAYWDYEVIQAGLKNWPVPVFEQKWQSDDNFEALTVYLMQNYDVLSPAIGSHNMRSIAHAMATAETLDVPRDAFELQMLYGMGNDQAQVYANKGYRVRIYTPFGELIPGMAYLVRRLLENTSNDSFLRHTYQEDQSIEELLMSPKQAAAKAPETPEKPKLPFLNEPTVDFSKKENREAMLDALKSVREECGQEYPIIISGKIYETRQQLTSRSPSDRDLIVGRVSSATSDLAQEAIETARRTLTTWAAIDADHRAEYLELLANEMRHRRFELAAWMVYESGKPWHDADADVAEAIDFCRYYALQMREMDGSLETNLPGEENLYTYRPRGVAVVIAPWNFPLAILTGMTAAALVTGNTVVMKPAEQSPVIAAKLMEMLKAIGLPDGVVNYLPGNGEEIGPQLVSSPLVDVVAFTGSREVGLEINVKAAETGSEHLSVKKVIAEMGGKNAIIVDDDADLDEAVAGVIDSAFGYTGQKCSACSRAVVLDKVYDEFTKRLVAAVESLQVGPADDPGTQLGPVIDGEARDRINEEIESALEEGAELLFALEIPEELKKGSYVAPHVFTNVNTRSRLAQHEVFGPVLAIMKARDFGDALKIANDTDYALTGGVYSRSPANLKRARNEFFVGNLYLNRPCTAALVHRQPFGGFRMSGIGTKAGGNDYLHQFLIPINITENTMRRGFAPEE